MLEIKSLSKSFHHELVVNDVSFHVGAGEFFSLLGPSGCGKTTLLRLLAGFEHPDRGDILFEGRSILALPPQQRPFNIVFQNYALFTHLNVLDNVTFGPKMRGIPKREAQAKAKDILRMVALGDFAHEKVSQLSGGQQQRVALARAIVNEPKILLLDEPLSALDLKLRQNLQRELYDLQRNLGITFIFVTHAQDEALALSDRIAVMQKGRIHQVAAPATLYHEPATEDVASFIGDNNILGGEWQSGMNGSRFYASDLKLTAPESTRTIAGRARCFIRPEHIELYAGPVVDSFPTIVHSVAFRGHDVVVTVTKDDVPAAPQLKVVVATDRALTWQRGTTLHCKILWNRAQTFAAVDS